MMSLLGLICQSPLQINGPEKPIAQKIDYPIAMTLFLLTDQLSPPVI